MGATNGAPAVLPARRTSSSAARILFASPDLRSAAAVFDTCTCGGLLWAPAVAATKTRARKACFAWAMAPAKEPFFGRLGQRG